MSRRFTAWPLVLALAVLLAGCSRPAERPAPEPGPSRPPVSGPGPIAQEPEPRTPTKPAAARFYLYEAGFRTAENRREFAPGDTVTVGSDRLEVEVALPVVTAVAARQAVKVEGAELLADPYWEPGRGLSFTLAPGKAGTTVTVTVQLPNARPVVLTLRRVAPARVTVEYRVGDTWRPVASMNGHVPPGSGEVRLTFSKPVRQAEVEKALTEAQATPVRGLMRWANEQTLIWQIAQMPPRLDLLTGEARDSDGLFLPGGISSLRVGEPPVLAEVELTRATEQVRASVPPDIVSAVLAHDGKHVNLTAWVPGTNRWDWQATDLYVVLDTGEVRPGRMDGVQPRVPAELENWVINPGGTLLAGWRTPQSGLKDLVVRDLRGGREQVVKSFVRQVGPANEPVYLVWSAQGTRVAALTGPTSGKGGLNLVALDIPAMEQTVLLSGLPLPTTGARLSWSHDGRYLQAGNLLADLKTGSHRALPGEPGKARGAWEPRGTRLLYSTEDWGLLFLADPGRPDVLPLGSGLLVDWSGQDRAHVIRWPAAGTRYLPPGQ